MAYDFGLRLQMCRKKAGLSQREVGRRLGITGTAVGKFESNISIPSAERLVSSQVKYRNFRQKMQSFSASIFSCNRPVVC